MSGSGGSGGYEYQHNAIAYVAAHILAGKALDWEIETGAQDIPIAVAAETNGPGDDLCITLQNNVVIELQAKHGLTKDKLFDPLLKLVKGLHEIPDIYGVLLTDSSASLTIRRDLRRDLVRLGQKCYDGLKSITLEFQDQLSSANLPKQDSDIFRRLRIIVLDLEDDMQGAKIAQSLLSNLSSDQNQAFLVWKILCDEGQKLTSNPGRRDIWAWQSLLQRHSILISGRGDIEEFSQQKNWSELCRKMLPTELDSNPLISGDGVTLGIEDILPLDLAEPTEITRSMRDPSPENFQQTLGEQEIPLSYNQLYECVLPNCKCLNQQGKGIAAIGEPGVGKTTLLFAIAAWILKRNELPIFVSLRDLNNTIEDYVLQVWLKEAGNIRKSSEQLQDALVERCNTGQVWLLLDGIDEMSQTDRTLYNLAQELRKGWLGNARVVVTCRTNVWETNRNDLGSKFESFRIRGLKDEDQITFIRNFFAKIQQPETGKQLIKKLENAPLRLKDLIKNPLWITLLCRTWKRRIGKLPETKTELYKGFVDTFYDWKNKPYIPLEKRHLLEQALGEVAKRLIDQEVSRFSFSESFIREELNRLDPSFFSIACELNWINKLGMRAGNSEEFIYTFLHPTFQEYFAALSISQADFFFPIDQGTSAQEPVRAKKYRAFDPQWEEVMSLWLEKFSKDGGLIISKKKLLRSLLSFQDGCGDFYSLKAYFLVVNSFDEINELSESEVENLLSNIIKYAFGYFDEVKQKWIFFHKPVRNKAKHTIWRSANIKSILKNQLLQLIDDCPRDHDRREIAMIIESMGICNEKTRSIIKAKVSFKVPPHVAKYCNLITTQVKAPIQAYEKALSPENSFHLLDDNLYMNMDLYDLIEQIQSTNDWLIITKVTEHLKSKTEVFQSLEIIRNLKAYIDPHEGHRSNSLETKHFRYEYIYEVVWNCCQNLSYTDFYKAWNTISLQPEVDPC